MFNFLNPFWWIKIIAGILILAILVLLPGLIKLFAQKTIAQIIETFSKNAFETLASIWKISFEFYKNWIEIKFKK